MRIADHGIHCLCEDCRPWPSRRFDHQVVDWRLKVLLEELGFDLETAERFSRNRDVDLGSARELVLKRNCPVELAARILEPV